MKDIPKTDKLTENNIITPEGKFSEILLLSVIEMRDNKRDVMDTFIDMQREFLCAFAKSKPTPTEEEIEAVSYRLYLIQEMIKYA